MSPNPNYNAGRRMEYARKKFWESCGYTVMRSAGSHGAFDLTCFRSDRPVVGLQCKRVEKRSAADRLIATFKVNPPLTPSKYFHQTIEVYVSEDRELLTATV